MTTKQKSQPKGNSDPKQEPPRLLKVKHGYRGKRTKEIFIPPGEYGNHSFELMGFSSELANYLVENGHAEWVEDKS